MKDDDGILKTMVDRTSIETEIIKYNKNFFEEPAKSKVYNDRIYERLYNQSIRNRILVGILRRSECDDPDLYEFLKLLKKPHGIMNSCPNPINKQMFVNAVKQSKKRSMLSIFSGRIYAVYKCAILN